MNPKITGLLTKFKAIVNKNVDKDQDPNFKIKKGEVIFVQRDLNFKKTLERVIKSRFLFYL